MEYQPYEAAKLITETFNEEPVKVTGIVRGVTTQYFPESGMLAINAYLHEGTILIPLDLSPNRPTVNTDAVALCRTSSEAGLVATVRGIYSRQLRKNLPPSHRLEVDSIEVSNEKNRIKTRQLPTD